MQDLVSVKRQLEQVKNSEILPVRGERSLFQPSVQTVRVIGEVCCGHLSVIWAAGRTSG